MRPPPEFNSGEVIATFGKAQLIKYRDRKYKLVGGSEPDRAEAQKWISMFMNNDILEGAPSTRVPGPKGGF
jgi:hypothetical protein